MRGCGGPRSQPNLQTHTVKSCAASVLGGLNCLHCARPTRDAVAEAPEARLTLCLFADRPEHTPALYVAVRRSLRENVLFPSLGLHRRQPSVGPRRLPWVRHPAASSAASVVTHTVRSRSPKHLSRHLQHIWVGQGALSELAQKGGSSQLPREVDRAQPNSTMEVGPS